MKRREFILGVGGAAASSVVWPSTARTQQKPSPVIGYLHFAGPSYAPAPASFLRGLEEAGYVEGRNVTLEYRWAEGRYDRSSALAAELVGRNVDLIAAFGPPLARAAKDATKTIPIVFEVGNDAVEAGLVDSLARPGGNITGLNILFTQLTPKLLELMSELRPQAKVVVLLVNPNSPTAAPMIRDTGEAARAKGIELPLLKASTESEIDAAFATLGDLHADGVIVGADPFFGTRATQLIGQAARAKIPTIYFSEGFIVQGGLISYGASLVDVYRRMGVYAGKILKGEKPADLPVEQPTKFDLSINLKTAHALGISVPPSLLLRADEVIE
jgi:putative tryptophan/tyrosine transport system substrate-binding protein